MPLRFEEIAVYGVIGTAAIGILYAIFLILQILRYSEGTLGMRRISMAIRRGARAYLHRQFRSIVFPIIFLALALYFTARADQPHIAIGRSLAFLMGSLFSFIVGYVGMGMAVRGNVRVAEAARSRGFGEALKIAYRTGTITGMLTDGLGLLGGSIIFLIYGPAEAFEVLLGYGFGGSLVALFMRVGGGIYTKAADVGADMVGKVEKGIPEDDPRNAAVIADLVGDNVGDCAGMAADIFESYEVTIVAAMILGALAYGEKGVIFPLVVRAMGVFSSILGTYAVRAWGTAKDALKSIFMGFNISAAASIIGFFALSYYYMNDLRPFYATLSGIMLAVLINILTDYFTSKRRPPVKEIATATQTGPATTLLTGISVGYESSVWAILVIAGAILASVLIYGADYIMASYGVALTGIGMLTLTGNNVAMDSYGPISDNASGIAEMAAIKEAEPTLAELDAVGNTTKAVTKGIAIGSAVVAAVSLFNSYIESTGLAGLSISDPLVFIGVLIGGSVPFLFSSIAIRAVGRGAHLIVREVRRQFHEIKGLWEGLAEPDYERPVEICTATAQKDLLGLGMLAILAPIAVGFLLHEQALGGFLAGAILSGQLLAVFMANAGGALDNAKKAVEAGLFGGKGSDAHKSSVVGDTVGDPLKDTAGPALNPMIKVINLVSLLIAPLVVLYKSMPLINYTIAGLAVGGLAVAYWYSKRGLKELKGL